ncbi:hypothetical protein NUW58_g2934 [Xylaria curta]|uniref:Uncharacterized protein n=1 Tax=Xylaria curta TaxID=42375 RepID=A0ACC1PEV8_9PEZI|nr:hypothetical protein NUW58_g2934 [Xylaria curta]
MSNLATQTGENFSKCLPTNARGMIAYWLTVDNFRAGYPRYTALLSTHPSFHNFRAFKRLRLRLLLAKQDEIVVLENKLDEIDAAEQRAVFLGCMRRDANTARQGVLRDAKLAMSEYDDMIVQYRHTMALPASSQREVQNLRNWIGGTGSLDRSESSYLQYSSDLVNLSGSGDNFTTYIESAIEECLYWLEIMLARVSPGIQIGRLKATDDHNVLILGPMLQTICRVVMITVVTLVIMMPTIALLGIASSAGRVVASILSGAFFLSMVSFLTQARTIEVFAAGASYAAVLVVFIAPK